MYVRSGESECWISFVIVFVCQCCWCWCYYCCSELTNTIFSVADAKGYIWCTCLSGYMYPSHIRHFALVLSLLFARSPSGGVLMSSGYMADGAPTDDASSTIWNTKRRVYMWVRDDVFHSIIIGVRHSIYVCFVDWWASVTTMRPNYRYTLLCFTEWADERTHIHTHAHRTLFDQIQWSEFITMNTIHNFVSRCSHM